MRYRRTHSYLTLDDDGNAVVESTEDTYDDIAAVTAGAVAAELLNPGGRSGTTITLTVAALNDVTI